MDQMNCDVCVIGGGSGGIGAALAAARHGLRVTLVERADRLGGNAVIGGVHNWEPGVGGTAYPREIYERLNALGAAGVWSFGRHCCWPGGEDFPGGETVIDPARGYNDTLRRYGSQGMHLDEEFCRRTWHGVVFEPDAYAKVVEDLLLKTSRCDILKGWSFTEAQRDGERLRSLRLVSNNGGDCRITARYFVDSTADARLCQAAGCEMMQGQEAAAEFGESAAPLKARPDDVNGVSLIYRVAPAAQKAIEPFDAPIGDCPWQKHWPFAIIGRYPAGDLNINMLPTMNGDEFLNIMRSPDGYGKAYELCTNRVMAHWHWMQNRYPEFQSFRLSWIAPSLGVRETKRVRGKYVLTQHDLIAGLSGQTNANIVAIADHAMDSHGAESAGIAELREPYGIPLGCLLPVSLDNVAVACRGASFSHIAATSCRLSRTMMDLGHAAGIAIAAAALTDSPLHDADVSSVREALRRDGASLG
ncbi:MAG: FAD-dependent oxidoreductase [Capsulimonadaceae bacterium]|nr:FAD-dependent oxidoreductase [Capsulimonadaceae bacterium]